PAAIQKTGYAIPPLHQGQDPVRAALQTEVQMRADTRRLGEGFHQLSANLRRLQAAQSNTEIARQGIETTQQMPKPAPLGTWFAAAEVDAIVAQMDAGKDNLSTTAQDQPLHFLSDLLDGPTA